MRWQRSWCLTEARAIILQAALRSLIEEEGADVMRTRATFGWWVEVLIRERSYRSDKALHTPEDSDAPHFPPRQRG